MRMSGKQHLNEIIMIRVLRVFSHHLAVISVPVLLLLSACANPEKQNKKGVSVGGDSMRVRFSNQYGSESVELLGVNIARSEGNGSIDTTTDSLLTFGGKKAVSIDPGMSATSDPFRFVLKPLTQIAITIYFGRVPSDLTGHPGSRTISFMLPGDHISALSFPGSFTSKHWYIIDSIDVFASESAAAVVVLGNSITDGRGSGTNRQNRWPDELANRLQNDRDTRFVAVLNAGIGGNCVLRDCLGPAALSRFERDVIGATGAHWLIILEGINDIGQTKNALDAAKVADELIAAYNRMIISAHAAGIRV